jgi:nitrile hydratase subunit alpha
MTEPAPPRPPVPERLPASEEHLAARTKALESILMERGYLSRDMVDALVEAYEQDIGPMLGARVVARAWVDPGFKARLLDDATAACAELGIGGMEGEHMRVVENTATVHNVVVCTLCSCYPWPVLGLPPTWYKRPEYRARIVAEPRTVLTEDFGLDLEETTEVVVRDSSSDLRWWVLPERPPGTEDLGEAELAGLVTRDAMIGVARAVPAGGR